MKIFLNLKSQVLQEYQKALWKISLKKSEAVRKFSSKYLDDCIILTNIVRQNLASVLQNQEESIMSLEKETMME